MTLDAPQPQSDATPPDAKATAMRHVLAQQQKAKKPRGFFSRVSRHAILLVLALTALNGPVRSDQPAPPPAPAATVQQVQTIAELESDFGRTPLGRQLLDYVHAKGITIMYEANQPTSYAAFQPDLNRIIVRPDLSREEQAIYLAHEIRHSWQQHELHYGSMEARQLSPEQRFTLRRFLEADARAFSAYFTADRHERLGLSDVQFGTAQAERQMVTMLRAEFNSANGLTPAEYRVLGLENSFGFLSGYNTRHLSMATERTESFGRRVEAADDANGGRDYLRIRENLLRLTRERNNAPSAHEFEVYLRHFGGTSFNVKAPTSLHDPAVTLQTLTYTYPRRVNNDPAGIGAKAINDTLTPLTAQYNAQSRRINEMRAQNDANIAQQRYHQNRAMRQLAQRNF
ncbi:MAG: hypothetical protein K0R10_209 [Alphaproteobacteria bacterium]|jgi:hypothetical protein|nr:hypothetical protein [Alphaproteobacteria bacterium]